MKTQIMMTVAALFLAAPGAFACDCQHKDGKSCEQDKGKTCEHETGVKCDEHMSQKDCDKGMAHHKTKASAEPAEQPKK